MNISYLKSFLEVLKRGSFSEAAKALGLSQPTISFHIQRLEEDTGAKLLERGGRKVAMTSAGREFQVFAERVVAEQEALQQHLAALQDQVAGTLALAASTIPGEHILPGILGDFRRRYPGVKAIVTISDSAEVVEQAAARQCDVGFIGAEIKRRSLALHKLVDDELVLLAPVDHPLTKRQAVKLSEVEGQPFIQREEGSGTQRSTEALLRRVGFNLPRTACPLRVSSSQAVIAAVEAGLGLAFVSRLAAARSLQCGACRTISLDGRSFMRSIYYTYLEKHQHSRPAQALLTFLEVWSKERA